MLGKVGSNAGVPYLRDMAANALGVFVRGIWKRLPMMGRPRGPGGSNAHLLRVLCQFRNVTAMREPTLSKARNISGLSAALRIARINPKT